MKCRRCGNRFRTAEGFAGIHLSRGRTALEQLRNGRTFYVCDSCAGQLQVWLRMPPGVRRGS